MNSPDALAGFSTFYLFATALSVGVTATLPLVPLRQIGKRFFILMTLAAVVFFALAIASRGVATEYLHLLCVGFLIAFNVVVSEKSCDNYTAARGRWLRFFSMGCLLAALGFGVAGLIADALDYPGEILLNGAQPVWISLTYLSSALVLGSALVSLVLGHWYLVTRGLSFGVLGRLVALLIVALVVRVVIAALVGMSQHEHWSRLWTDAGGPLRFFMSDGLFVGARVLFGMALPLILALMARQCVRIRANQSATGILYVAVAFVIIGEAIAKHLFLQNGVLV